MRYHPVKFGGRSHSTSGVIMILVCHMISQDRLIKGSYDPNGWEPLMVYHHPVKIGGHRPCCSGDIMFLVVEEEDSRCSRFNPSLKDTG